MIQQDPKKSKCWTCKHGHCVSQTHREVLYAEMAQGPDEQEDEDDFSLDLPDFSEPGKVEDPHQGHVHEIEKHGVMGFCYYMQATPIAVQIVHECNRYDAE
jgi:hypothetical protein